MKCFNAPERECSVETRDRNASCADSFHLRDHSSPLLTAHYWRFGGHLRRDGYYVFPTEVFSGSGKRLIYLVCLIGCVRYPTIADFFYQKVLRWILTTSPSMQFCASVSGERNELSESMECKIPIPTYLPYLYEKSSPNHPSPPQT